MAMGTKDVTEKHLEAYADVFADIVNVTLLLGTGLRVEPDELLDTGARTVYKSSGELREQERDVAKLWKRREVIFCLFGLENQTRVDRFMPLRVQGYEGGDVRFQLARRDDELRSARRAGDEARLRQLREMKFYPVVTLVLYYGMGHWTGPRSVLECMDVAEELRPFVNDCRLNVVEVAWLTEEQRSALTSDFRIVAEYFHQMRVNRKYEPSRETIRHVGATLDLMRALTGDYFFEEAQAKLQDKLARGEEISMYTVFGEAIDKGRTEGIRMGRDEGIRVGRDEGIRMGRDEERQIILRRLIDDGMTPERAARIVGLSESARTPASL